MEALKIKKLNLTYLRCNCGMCGKPNEQITFKNVDKISETNIVKVGCKYCSNVDVITSVIK